MTKFKQIFNILILIIVFSCAINFSTRAQEQTRFQPLSDTISIIDSIIVKEADAIPTAVVVKNLDNPYLKRLQESITDSIPDSLKYNLFRFYINSSIYYIHISQFRTIDGKNSYLLGYNSQIQLKKLAITTDSLRRQYEISRFNDEKELIAKQLLQNEMILIDLQNKPDQYFNLAREQEMAWWKAANSSDYTAFEDELKIIPSELDRMKPKPEIPIQINDIEHADISTEITDSTAVKPSIKSIQEPAVPKVIYKVQIGTFYKVVPPQTKKKFDQLALLRKIDQITDDKETLILSIGELSKFNDAVNLQNQIRQEGIKDAFVVAYLDGKRISLSDAKKMTEP